MGRYLYELINEKKELQLKLDNYNNMLDKNFGSEKYFAIKHKHYKAMNELELLTTEWIQFFSSKFLLYGFVAFKVIS